MSWRIVSASTDAMVRPVEPGMSNISSTESSRLHHYRYWEIISSIRVNMQRRKYIYLLNLYRTLHGNERTLEPPWSRNEIRTLFARWAPTSAGRVAGIDDHLF